jgi:hypothetical protein
MVMLYLVVLARAGVRELPCSCSARSLTLILSTWLDNEAISASLFLGGLVILAGVYVGALRQMRRASEVVPAP